jgi:nucleoside-diphosphate-sugar epimerase
MDHVMVTGAGGIIGGHLVGRLRDLGVGHIRAVDCKSKDEWYQVFDDVENVHAHDNGGREKAPAAICRKVAIDAVDIVEGIAGGEARPPLPHRRPPGRVRGRNSDNTPVRELPGWAPSGTREDGLAATYTWVHEQVAARVAR